METTKATTPKTIVNAEGKRVKRPVKTSERKRPNRAFIEKMAEIRGFMSGNEKTLITGLKVKNALQRVNNRAMSEDVTTHFTGEQNAELQRLMKEFAKGVDAILGV